MRLRSLPKRFTARDAQVHLCGHKVRVGVDSIFAGSQNCPDTVSCENQAVRSKLQSDRRFSIDEITSSRSRNRHNAKSRRALNMPRVILDIRAGEHPDRLRDDARRRLGVFLKLVDLKSAL